jgi:hypothetical protein
MNQSGKLENLKTEINILGIDMLELSEMKWPQQGDFWSGNIRVIHTGAENGIVLRRDVGKTFSTVKEW